MTGASSLCALRSAAFHGLRSRSNVVRSPIEPACTGHRCDIRRVSRVRLGGFSVAAWTFALRYACRTHTRAISRLRPRYPSSAYARVQGEGSPRMSRGGRPPRFGGTGSGGDAFFAPRLAQRSSLRGWTVRYILPIYMIVPFFAGLARGLWRPSQLPIFPNLQIGMGSSGPTLSREHVNRSGISRAMRMR